MNLLLFGPPGAGKGTQSTFLVEKLDMRHISTGDLFRSAMKNNTELGQKAKQYMDKGQLVPDEIVIGMVEEKLKSLSGQSFILDGFPRTEPQAQALDKLLDQLNLKLDWVVSLSVPDETLISRLTGRRVCKACGAVYHTDSKPTQKEGVCDVCGGEVIQRADDKEEVIKDRLEVYRKNTAPLIDYYQAQNKLLDIDGTGATEAVFERIKEAVTK
ncbi:MAG: adenylate kinase [Bdellovibrionales bacterium]|nr:adenylate kinase [Bdellovibrionales bacterium]